MRSSRELEYSFAVVLIVALAFVAYQALGIPGDRGPIRYLMGITGMTMMLLTEILYAFRKRVRWLQVGRLRGWLSFHIFTGIIGPTLVLTHSSFQFNGLAGLSMLFTTIVVVSGFVGRYFYTAIPHARSGAELSPAQITAWEAQVEAQIVRFADSGNSVIQAMMATDAAYRAEAQQGSSRALLARAFVDLRYQRALSASLRQVSEADRKQTAELSRLLRRRREAERQIAANQSAHRLLGAWRTVHVPLGITMFVSAFLHVIGTLFYGASRIIG